ncbi:MAG: MmcQ/YjbR family DNA-binding protein [Clostridia bacterium]|nr:MmcQ/YjbR family DNA-binding protein [Clostridia bacterium]
MIDTTIFDHLKPDVEKLISSGFGLSEDGSYLAKTPVSGGDFLFFLRIRPDGSVSTDVLDAGTGEPYMPYSVREAQGAFIGALNEECQLIAQRTADTCFAKPGPGEQEHRISSYLLSKYNSVPERLWPEKYPDNVVWRRNDTGKWICLMMLLSASKLGIDSERTLPCMNLHVPEDTAARADHRTIFPAYHMNKKHWVTIILDGRMPIEDVMELIDTSYSLAK